MKKKLPVVKDDEKTLMPEVLPEPPVVGNDRRRSPRERTVGHMRAILAAAAALGVAATTSRSRSEPIAPGADPPPPPPDAATFDASASDAQDDATLADATDDASDAQRDAPVYDYDARPGYDPAPPPPDANMNPGFDPIGPSGSSGGDNSGCSCDMVGRKRR